MRRFCVKCGKETNELVRSLCKECYMEKHSLIELPKEMELDFDARSGKIKAGHEWVVKGEQSVGELVGDKVLKLAKKARLELKNLRIDVEDREKYFDCAVSFGTSLEGVELAFERQVKVRLRKTISDASMKLASNYHEAIIQVRFRGGFTDKEAESKRDSVLELLREQKLKDELSEAIDVKGERGGYDLFVGSAKSARIVSTKAARKFNGQVVHSSKLLGTDRNGKVKFRHTFCIRF